MLTSLLALVILALVATARLVRHTRARRTLWCVQYRASAAGRATFGLHQS